MFFNAKPICSKFQKYDNRFCSSIEHQMQWLTPVGAQLLSKSLVFDPKIEYKQLTRDSRLEEEETL